MIISYLLTDGLYYESDLSDDIWIHLSNFLRFISPYLGELEHGLIIFLWIKFYQCERVILHVGNFWRMWQSNHFSLPLSSSPSTPTYFCKKRCLCICTSVQQQETLQNFSRFMFGYTVDELILRWNTKYIVRLLWNMI